MRFLFLALMFYSCCFSGAAQKSGLQSYSMKHGEKCVYDLYYKWGLLMTNAGEATFKFTPDHSIAGATSLYHLLYKSSKMLDRFFKMRDTLFTYYDNNNTLKYSAKHSDEGGYYLIDLMTFKKEGAYTNIYSQRIKPTGRFDTLLVTKDEVADLLGILFYIRGFNRSMLRSGDIFPLTIAIGKDLVKIQFIYQNQAIIEHGNVKYNTHYFKIDIFDDAFESKKASAEVWVGDDDNFLPIKVRSKMKLGYVEIYYKSSLSLAHPLSCRIPMK
jgi:hypothetical protein